jgi:uncharacterized protein YndB with AHSA1/START domain
MTAARLEITMPPDEPVIAFRRFLRAPPELVFQTWTDPAHLRHWRGPRELELVSCEIDLRVGGGYRYVHKAQDGQEFAFHGEYREIDRPSRLVSTFVYEGSPEDVSVETVTFKPVDGGTLLVSRSVLPSLTVRDRFVQAGAARGLAESHERLDEWLDMLQSGLTEEAGACGS